MDVPQGADVNAMGGQAVKCITAIVACVALAYSASADPLAQWYAVSRAVSGSDAPAWLPDNCTVWLDFSEESSSNYYFDVTGNGNDFQQTTNTRAGYWYTNGVYLDGSDDHLAIPDNATLQGNSNHMTVAAWVRPITTPSAYKCWASHWTYQTQGDWAITHYTTGIRVFFAPTLTDAGGTYQSTGAIVGSNAWHHVAVVYDGTLTAASRCKIYVDGALVSSSATGTIPAYRQNASAAFSLGNWGGSAGYWWFGAVDEYMMFDAPLTLAQVTNIYVNTLTGHP